jgi:hypothetical protein
MKAAFVLVALFGGFVLGCGGGGASSCSSVCNKLFTECKLTSFSTPGGTAYPSNCVSLCEDGMKHAKSTAQQLADCVEATSCSELSSCQ